MSMIKDSWEDLVGDLSEEELPLPPAPQVSYFQPQSQAPTLPVDEVVQPSKIADKQGDVEDIPHKDPQPASPSTTVVITRSDYTMVKTVVKTRPRTVQLRSLEATTSTKTVQRYAMVYTEQNVTRRSTTQHHQVVIDKKKSAIPATATTTGTEGSRAGVVCVRCKSVVTTYSFLEEEHAETIRNRAKLPHVNPDDVKDTQRGEHCFSCLEKICEKCETCQEKPKIVLPRKHWKQNYWDGKWRRFGMTCYKCKEEYNEKCAKQMNGE